MTHMPTTVPRQILLASGSEIRATLLRNAGLVIDARPARIDEEAIRAALDAEGATPRDVADALAEMKAKKLSDRHPAALVIGCDQVLDLDGQVLSKPGSVADARAQLASLRGRTHRLLSAVVVCHEGRPLWRHVGTARLTMREFSDDYLESYIARNWPDIGDSVGCYKLESEGVRLFSRIEGDYFSILGLPLIELLTWLAVRGDIAA
jgi:septum formation protein